MKRFLSRVSIVLILLMLFGCSNKNSNATENGKSKNANAVVENQEQKEKEVSRKLEDATPETKEDHNKNLKVVAGTPEVVKILQMLDYKDVVAVPEGCQDIYKDAVSIGEVKNPNVDVVNSFFGDWGDDVIFISDISEQYSEEFLDKNKLPGLFFISDNDLKEKIYSIGEELGLEKTAENVIESL